MIDLPSGKLAAVENVPFSTLQRSVGERHVVTAQGSDHAIHRLDDFSQFPALPRRSFEGPTNLAELHDGVALLWGDWVLCWDAAGSLRWRHELGPAGQTYFRWVVSDGVDLYVAARADNVTRIKRLDLGSGRTLWERTSREWWIDVVLSPDALLVGSTCSATALTALAPNSGETLWQLPNDLPQVRSGGLLP